MPELATYEHSDFFFVNAAEPEEIVRKLITLVRDRIPRRFNVDPVRDIQVLCPMNRGGVGARSLNVALQAALNPSRENTVNRFGTTRPDLSQRAGYRKVRLNIYTDGDGCSKSTVPMKRALAR